MCSGQQKELRVASNDPQDIILALRLKLRDEQLRLSTMPERSEVDSDQSYGDRVSDWALDERRRIEVVILNRWIGELAVTRVRVVKPRSE